MFVQGAVHGNADSGRFRVREGHLVPRDGLMVVDSGFIESAGKVERLPIGLDGAVIQILQCILAARFEEILREIGLLRETLVFEIRGAYLGGVSILANRGSDAAPYV